MSISKKDYTFELSYDPYNFYYSTNRQDLPDKKTCDELIEQHDNETLKCDQDEKLRQCYQYELCKNKNLANEMFERRNNHITSDASYDHLHLKYQYAVLKTVNLSVGIIGSIIFIYYYNK
jgi:hypothetical protein